MRITRTLTKKLNTILFKNLNIIKYVLKKHNGNSNKK